MESKTQTEYEFHKPIKGICKSHAIWRRGKLNSISPMVYLRKPKYVSEDEFNNFISKLSFLVKE